MQNAIKGRQPCQCSCTEMRVAQVCKHQVLQKCASAFLVWSFVFIYRSFKSHFSEAKTTSAYGECFEVFRTHFWAAWTCVRFVFPFKQRSHSLDVNWRSQSGYILSLFLLNSLLSFCKDLCCSSATIPMSFKNIFRKRPANSNTDQDCKKLSNLIGHGQPWLSIFGQFDRTVHVMSNSPQ